MPEWKRLSREFFERNTVEVARDLLGKRLIRLESDKRIGGIIVETEAYRGEEDLGCHAKAGRTQRTQVMYGSPGHAYIYFTYGMHWLLNFVTEKEGFPAAVLIRALIPLEGVGVIESRRNGQPTKHWTDGPAKLCQALGIDGELNGIDVCTKDSQIFVENTYRISNSFVTNSSRVGLNTVPEPWRSILWRFKVTDSTIEF